MYIYALLYMFSPRKTRLFTQEAKKVAVDCRALAESCDAPRRPCGPGHRGRL